jgi:hypothetical protein
LPSNNIYNSGANKDRVAASSKQRAANVQKADRVAKGPNNVYADKGGNVYRQNQGGNWQSRDQGQWKSLPSASTQPSQGSSGARSGTSPSDLNRDAQARQSGANRSPSSYGGSSYGGSRGGGNRGGGGRGGRGGGGRR